MTKLSKNYRAAIEKIGEEAYAPLAAMNLVKEVSTAKFDETVTVDFRLGIDTRQAAVSYTHLDVYKRQSTRSARRMRAFAGLVEGRAVCGTPGSMPVQKRR